MSKALKIIVLILLISISGIITFYCVEYHIERKKFEKGAVKYLSQKYDENMIVIKTEKSIKEGWITYVYPKNMPELKFEVECHRDTNEYYDRYLYEYLENDIYEEIKKITSDKPISNIYVFVVGQGPDFNNLIYQKYKDMKRPASWKDIGISPQINRLKICFSEVPGEEEVLDIVKRISELQYDIDFLVISAYEDEKQIILYSSP